MEKYQATIGLEIHAILKTRTKMFCDSLNDPEEKEPNKNVCPVCLGHPGVLPTINQEALEHVIRVGLALGGTINSTSKFDRKNYFYPDLPKGYQISQYDQPLVTGGELNGVRIRRVHLEEDAGRLLHEIPGETKRGEASYVDFNRAGVPLMELVTEPDLRSAEEVVVFAEELQRILRYLEASNADMEKGQMRVEANVSLNMGPKVELKNINSFRAVDGAIAYELKRQREVLERGEKVVHETRGWNEAKQETYSQRAKEEAHDYRYFPEPDLPPFDPPKIFDLEKLKIELPELPAAKRERFRIQYHLEGDALRFLTDQKYWADYFEQAASELDAWRETLSDAEKEKAGDQKEYRKALIVLLTNYLLSDLQGILKENASQELGLKIRPEHLARLITLIASGRIGSRQAKDILRKMFETGTDPEEIMKDEGLETVSDMGEIENIAGEVIAEQPQAAEDFKKGKEASLQFLIGQAMKKLRGRGNPEQLKEVFLRQLT